jgi:hypothetical protein
MIAPSVVDIEEDKLVELLYQQFGPWRHMAIPPLTSGPIAVRLRVRPEQLGLDRRAFGDIDALLLERDDCSHPRAIQYKRVKVTGATFATGLVNKLHEVKKAIAQTNAIVDAGFAYVWLEIMVVTDARLLAGGRYIYLSAPMDIMDKVISAIPMSDLRPQAGVVITEIAQSIDRPVTETGSYGGRMLRAAVLQPQPASLTASIAEFFSLSNREHQ